MPDGAAIPDEIIPSTAAVLTFSEEDNEVKVTGVANGYESGITSIFIPSNVSAVEPGAFADSIHVNEFTVSSPVFKVIDGVLYNADGKTLLCYPAGKGDAYFTVPASVTAIGDRAFSGCSGVSTVKFPLNSLWEITISGNPFKNCNGLTTILVPDELTISGNIATEAAVCRYVEDDKGNIISVLVPSDKTIPDTVIPSNAAILTFDESDGEIRVLGVMNENKSTLVSILIPQSVGEVADGAFCDCDALKTVLVPDSITIEGLSPEAAVLVYRFEETESGLSIEIDSNVKNADQNSIKTLFIPECVKRVPKFYSLEKLELILLPDGAVSEYETADLFTVCRYFTDYRGNIITVLVPWEHDVLSEISEVIPPTAAILMYHLESDIYKVKSVTTVEDDINLNRINSVFMPMRIKEVDSGAFWDCPYVETVIVPEDLDISDAGIPKSAVILTYTEEAASESYGEDGTSGSVGRTLTGIQGACQGSVNNKKTIIIPMGYFSDYAENAFQNCTNAVICVPGEMSGDSEAIGVEGATYDVVPYNKVIFDSNGGTVTMPDDFYYGTIPARTELFVSPADQVNNQTFVCWNTKADGSGISYGANREILPHENLKLYAQWGYPVTLEASDVGFSVVAGMDNRKANGGYVIDSGENVRSGAKLVRYTMSANSMFEPIGFSELTVENETTVSAVELKKRRYELTVCKNVDAPGCNVVVDDGDTKEIVGNGTLMIVEHNSQVTLSTTNPDNFIGWFAPNGELISYNSSFTFTMYGNATYEARYKSQDSKLVKFTAGGNVIRVVEIGSGDEIDSTDIPKAPVYHGFLLAGWTVSGNGEGLEPTDVSDVTAAINRALEARDELTVTARYVSTSNPADVSLGEDGRYHVLVKKISAGGSSQSGTHMYAKSQWVTFGPAESEFYGAEFSHWELDGVKISTNPTVSFRVARSCELTAVYKEKVDSGDPSFEILRARYIPSTEEGKDGELIVEARLVNAPAGDGEVYFRYNNVTGDKIISCAVDPDGDGIYAAVIPDAGLHDMYAITPVATFGFKVPKTVKATVNEFSVQMSVETVTGTTICGKTIKIDPEIGYDCDEKACAEIIDQSSQEYEDEFEDEFESKEVTFVAYFSVPEGATIDQVGVLAMIIREDDPDTKFREAEVLDFSNADYVKKWKPEKTSSGAVIYTWTKSAVRPGDTVYVRPYVIYDKSDEKCILIGKREQYQS